MSKIFSVGETLTAADVNAYLNGNVVGYTAHTADYVLTGSSTDVVSVTVTLTAGRRYRVSAHVHGYISASGDFEVHAKLMDGSTMLAKDRMANGAFVTVVEGLQLSAVVTGSGSKTFKVQAFTSSTSSNGLIADGASGAPGYILVEDIGSV